MNGFRPLRKNFATTSYPFRIKTSEKFISKNFRCFDPKAAKFSVVFMRKGSAEVKIRAFSQSNTRWLAQFRELRFWHPCFYFVIIFLSKVDESWGLEAEAAWIFPRTQEPRACRPCRDGTDRRQVVRVLTYIICEAGTWRLLEFIPVQAPKMLGCCERACHVPTYSR